MRAIKLGKICQNRYANENVYGAIESKQVGILCAKFLRRSNPIKPDFNPMKLYAKKCKKDGRAKELKIAQKNCANMVQPST